jgi:SAM-dependent methyltransferase
LNLCANYAWNLKHLIVRDMAKKVSWITVLDAGCGNGKPLEALLALSNKGLGIGVDVQSYANWKKCNVDYIRADVRHLPLKTHSFDLVLSTEVIEHFHEGEIFLEEVKRVLKARGHLIISTPNRLRWSSIVGRPFRRIAGKPPSPEHVHEYTPMQFKTMLYKTKFRIAEFRYGALNPYLAPLGSLGCYPFVFTLYLILDKLTGKVLPSIFKWDQIVLATRD